MVGVPSFGPEVISPTASVTDEDILQLTGLVPTKWRGVAIVPNGVIRLMRRYFVGVFTNITRIRVIDGREELESVAATFGTSFDIRLAKPVLYGFQTQISILHTTGAGPSYTLFVDYNDVRTRRL